MLPIRQRLQRELVLPLGGLFLASALLVWWGVGRMLDHQIQARIQESLDQVSGDLLEDLDRVVRVGETAGKYWESGLISTSDVPSAEATLAPLMQMNPEVANLVFVTVDGWGLSMMRQPQGLTTYHLDARKPEGLRRDLRVSGVKVQATWRPTPYRVFERPWFHSAREAEHPHWVTAYRFVNIPTQGFSFVVPLRDASGELKGAICADIYMDTLSQRVRAAEPTSGAQVIMSDDALRALILPEGLTIPRSKTNPEASFEPISPTYLPAFHTFLKEWERLGCPTTPSRVRAQGEGWTVATRKLPAMPWRLTLAVPDRDTLGPARSLALILGAIGLLGLAWGGIRLLRFSRELRLPLEALAEGAMALGEGKPPLPVSSNVRELDQVATALVKASEALAREEELRQQLGHSQRVELLGALAGGIAHDVNNQLAAIVGQLYLARTRLDEGHPALSRLDRAEAAAQRCSQTLRALLAFSRKAESDQAPLDLNALLQHTSQLLEPLMGGHVHLELDLASGLPLVMGDAVGLEQVVMNLALNARDATTGGGRVLLRTDQSATGDVRLHVEDQGEGMTEQVQTRIFEPFFTTKVSGKGTGLGLAMVHSIVEAHQGRIEVRSRVGEGTCFTISLSPFRQEAPQRESFEAALVEGLAGRRILVVEDEPTLRELMLDLFIQQRAHVEAVPDGMQAWALVQAIPYDLVVTDHRMPFMTGLELVTHIRASGRAVPIILASGFGLEGKEAELSLDPRLRLLPKPFSMRTLFQISQELVANP